MDPRHAEKMKKARTMFNKLGNPSITDPVNWLFNQTNMRRVYEDAVSTKMHPLNMSADLMDYMKFMYDSFPAGYSETLINEFKAQGGVTGNVQRF